MQNQHLQQNVTEENIKFLLSYAPFKLDKDDKLVREIGLYLLPYSTGFEIECSMAPGYDVMAFKNIPNIMEADVNDYGEQRFRIPNGIEGLICLFHIAEKMRMFAYPNPESGIHYHVDCTDWFDNLNADLLKEKEEYILTELDKWNYQGTYNRRSVGYDIGHRWLRTQSYFKTLEFRCGEMTFDYNLLFTRITHANDIVRNIKSGGKPVISKYGQNAKEIINNRIIKI